MIRENKREDSQRKDQAIEDYNKAKKEMKTAIKNSKKKLGIKCVRKSTGMYGVKDTR